MILQESSGSQTQKIPHKTLNLLPEKSVNSILLLITCLFFIQFLLLSVNRKIHASFSDRTTNTTTVTADVAFNLTIADSNSVFPECPYGKVYVYDLPSRFNRALLRKYCFDYHATECAAANNHGFGEQATELRRLVPANLVRSWYRTSQFSLEVIFHYRMLHHPCRTKEPESAAAFYVPFYAGVAVEKYLWRDADIPRRDRRCSMLMKWLRKKKPWRKSHGSDHFLTLGRITWDFRRTPDPHHKWGSSFTHMPGMKHVSKLIIEKATWDTRELTVPYPTGFHPKSLHALTQWQTFIRTQNRTRLFSFVGATRPHATHDLRRILRRQCQNKLESCWLVDCDAVDCARNTSTPMEAFLGSEFCLQPMGDSFTRKSVFDCILAGSVPVYFWKETAYEQYDDFMSPGDPKSYSVYIDHEEVRSGTMKVNEVLTRYSKEDIRMMREKVIETIPRIIYGDLSKGGFSGFRDGFDVAVDKIMERINDGS